MVINKITVGFVVQRYDTDKKIWLDQEFKAGDDATWENLDGDMVEAPENAGDLTMEMIQPLTVENFEKALNQPPLIAKPEHFEKGESVNVVPTGNPNDLIQHEFTGTVAGFVGEDYIIVKDQDDADWACEPSQVHHAMA